MSEEKEKEWVAPLVRAMLQHEPLEDSMGPMFCPICECDHQVFSGMGCLCPDSTGTYLVCAFPSTETLVKIDMPTDIKLAGLTTYVRYHCECNNHTWALFTAFHKERTMAWCVNLESEPPKQPCKHKGKDKKGPASVPALPPLIPNAQPMAQTLQQVMQQIAAANPGQSQPPIILLGADSLQQLPAVLKQLQNPAQPPPALPLPPPQVDATPDHEDPLVRLPATLPFAWQNWKEKGDPDKLVLEYQLPHIPVGYAPAGKPPHLAVGTADQKSLKSLQDWIFEFAVELGNTATRVHSLVYWKYLLLVVSNAKDEERSALASSVAETVIKMQKFKPDLYLMTRAAYAGLVANKAIEAAKKKK